VAPYVVVGSFTLPFAGLASDPQSLMVQVGAAPLQVPSAWQVRVAAPDIAYPVEQEYVATAP
jgi:hypothetical protein